jgi:hypothetical protein
MVTPMALSNWNPLMAVSCVAKSSSMAKPYVRLTTNPQHNFRTIACMLSGSTVAWPPQHRNAVGLNHSHFLSLILLPFIDGFTRSAGM